MLCLRKKRLILGLLVFACTFWLLTLIFPNSNRSQFLIDPSDIAVKLRSSHVKQSEYIDKKGMHVVVGTYVGDALTKETPKFTQEELDNNGYNPKKGAGEQGQPVFLNGRQADVTAKRLWHINKFNLVVSDMIALNRTLPDVRKEACQKLNYGQQVLPSATIIIVFHNEAWSTLMRTIYSVISRTPRYLLKQIILVDDNSQREFLGASLEEDVSKLEVPVKIIRTGKRIGLIKARLEGAKNATGQVLIFLDAHCEVTQGWIEPLLGRISEKRTAVVCPVIDIINDDNFSYVKSFSLHWGAFNWELHFRWFTMGKSVMESFVATGGTQPFSTPAMAGGLFAIDRQYFYDMGSYDEKMDIWGGENLEMSFRIWMCGGTVEIAPCSHVGHVFRKASPYTFPREGGVNHVLHTNLARVASVWLDDHAKFYFKLNPRAREESAQQDVSQRRQLRADLQCKSFQWYLDNVWPENFFPSQSRRFGKLVHVTSKLCLQRPHQMPMTSSKMPQGQALLAPCDTRAFQLHQQIVVSEQGFIMTDESMCLDVPNYQDESAEASARFSACNQMERQEWSFDDKTQVVTHKLTKHCLTYVPQGSSDPLVIKPCRTDLAEKQQFNFIANDWQK